MNWMRLSPITGARDNDSRVVREFQLLQNYPNPFNPSTTIKYQVSKTSLITLIIFDLLGREVTFLVNEEKPAGEYDVQWNASNMPSGIYFCRLKARQTSGGQAGIFTETKKLLLLK